MANYIDQKLLETYTPGAADIYVRDTELKGFTLKITPAGKFVFQYQYRGPDGRQRKITIGDVTSMDALTARARATQCRDALKAGRDPMPEQREVRRMPSLAEAWAEYIRAKTKTLRESTAKEYERCFHKYVDAKLKGRRVNEITFLDVDKNVRKIADESGQAMAHNVRVYLSGFFEWCRTGGRYIDKNPTEGVSTSPPKKRGAVFSEQELSGLGAALAERAGKEWAPNIFVIKFLLYTGARKTEGLQLKWVEVDWANRCAVLPPERHKTGRRGEPRTIPLSKQAIEVLEAAKAFGLAISGGQLPEYCFPSQRDHTQPIVGLQKIWDRIRKAAGIKYRLHDMRHNVGSVGGEHVHQVQVREVLGHKSLVTTNAYMKGRTSTTVAAADKIGDAVETALKRTSNVVRFGGKQ